MKPWWFPKIDGSILQYRIPTLCPTYIGERRTTFAKACGIKGRCYGEYVEEQIGSLGNILGTHWELSGNIVRTHWNQGKMKKKSSPCAPPKLKRKKTRHLCACLGLPIGCMKFLSQKSSSPFWPGLIPFAKNTLPIQHPVDISRIKSEKPWAQKKGHSPKRQDEYKMRKSLSNESRQIGSCHDLTPNPITS